MLRTIPVVSMFREPLFVAFVLSMTIFIPLLCAPGYSFDQLPDSVFDFSVRSIENTIVMCSTLSLTMPLIIDMALDLFSYKNSDISYLGYRFLSIFSIVVINGVSLNYQHVHNAASIAITMFTWGFYIEFCVIASFMHYLIPEYFSLNRVVFLNALIYCIAIIPNVFPISASPHTALTIIFYLAFYTYAASFTGFVFMWLLSLRRSFFQSKLSLWNWAKTLTSNDVCTLSLLCGLSLTVFTFIILFHVLVPDMPNVSNVSNGYHLLVDITRSSLCIFTYIIPYRMFRERLIEARRDLEIKTEFIKYISHEMRSPVGAIQVGLELMQNHLKPLGPGGTIDMSDIKAQVVDMTSTAKSVIEILDDLLLYESLERNTVVLAMTLQDPVKALSSIIRHHPHPIQLAPFDYHMNSNWRINLDKSKMKIVLNAIINHGAQRSGSTNAAELGAEPKPDEGQIQISFTLINGVTLPQQKVRRRSSFNLISPEFNGVFRVTVHDSRAARYFLEDYKYLSQEALKFEREGHDDGNGSGFGLWIARKFVKLHGADISATVTEAQDAVVIQLDFPIVVLEEGADSGHKASSSYVHVSPKPSAAVAVFDALGKSDKYNPELGPSIETMLTMPSADTGMRVLLVDDSKMVRKVTGQLMQGLGHTLVEATDGAEGVEMVRRSIQEGVPYDVILMDNQMPQMMGTEATRIIREQLGYTGLIFGVTGNALEDDIKAFVAHGADEVILKPLTKDKFNERVSPMCNSRRSSLQSLLEPMSGRESPSRLLSVNSKASPSSKSSPDKEVPVSLPTTMRVLLVDDSAMVRRVTMQLMKSMGHTTVDAADGDEGVEMVRRSIQEGVPYDVILMDNQMPRMMGTEATRIIREQLGYTGLIFGVTGNALEDDIKAFVAHGADEVILKPLTKDKFMEHIAVALPVDKKNT